MSLRGSRQVTPFAGSNTWAVNVPAGLSGDRQFIVLYYGLGATYTVGSPTGWTQWHSHGHSSEDVTVRVFTRSLSADAPAGQTTFTFTGPVPGVASAESWVDVSLTQSGTPGEGLFSTTFTPAAATADADGFRLDFVACKDARSLVSWPNMQGVASDFVGAANTVSGFAGHRTVTAGATTGQQLTIQDAFGGSFDTAPFVSSTIFLASTATGRITFTGSAVLPDSVDVETVSLSEIVPMAVGATQSVTVTVTGTDGNPLAGVVVTAVAPSIATVDSSTKTTDSNGQVVFVLTGAFAGERQFSVSAGGVSGQSSITVTGAETVIDVTDDVMTAGNQNTISVIAFDASGDPIANTAVSFTFSGVAVMPVTASAVTDQNGRLNYVIQADTAGQFTARATVAGTPSLPITVTVNPVITQNTDALRLRGVNYERTNPIKR